jgi:proteasome lid subunit RPN8/RPN11
MSGEAFGAGGDDLGGPPTKVPSISAEHLEAIYRQARAEFPRECCGYIRGEGEDAELVPCKNTMDEQHRRDPERYPRTAENGYHLGFRDVQRLDDSLGTDRPARIVYHSHPRVGAYFSDEDTQAAIAADWPVDYLVVDVQEREVAGAVLFRREGEHYIPITRFPGMPV